MIQILTFAVLGFGLGTILLRMRPALPLLLLLALGWGELTSVPEGALALGSMALGVRSAELLARTLPPSREDSPGLRSPA